MSRDEFAPVEVYTGNGLLAEYDFDFKIEEASQLQILVYSSLDVLLYDIRGDDTGSDLLDSVVFDSVEGGGTVYLEDVLTTGYKLRLVQANDAPTQPNRFRGHGNLSTRAFEEALDWIGGAVQRASWLAKRSIKLHILTDPTLFDVTLPPDLVTEGASRIPTLNSDASGWDLAANWISLAELEALVATATAAASAAAASAVTAAADAVTAAAAASAAAASAVAAAASAAAAAASAAGAAASSGVLTTFYATGDGIEDTFDTGVDMTVVNFIMVFIDGIFQDATNDYSVSTTDIIFTDPPIADSEIVVTIGTVQPDVATALAAALAAQAAAEAAQAAAETAETNAETAQGLAEDARDAAALSAIAADASADAAAASAIAADASADAAAQSAIDAAAAAATGVQRNNTTPTADNRLARWDGTTSVIQTSPITVTDGGAVSGADSYATTGGAYFQLLKFGNTGGGAQTFQFNNGPTGPSFDLFDAAGYSGFSSELRITPSHASVVDLLLRGKASQAADMLQVTSSADVVLSGLDEVGNFFAREQATVVNPPANMHIIFPKSDGKWYTQTSAGVISALGGGALVPTGTRGAPSSITAAGGIAFTGTNDRQVWYVQGNAAAAIDVTANPQVAAGTVVNQELVIVGTSDTATVYLEHGTGLDLNGPMLLGNSNVIGLLWDGTTWVEMYRR